MLTHKPLPADDLYSSKCLGDSVNYMWNQYIYHCGIILYDYF
jgi:hypothetical protein